MKSVVYNTTFVLQEHTRDQFLSFLKETYIPGLLEQGILSSPRLMRILSEGAERGTLSYALQFVASSHSALIAYLESYEAGVYPTLLVRQFGETVVGFSTLMELEQL